MFVANQKEKVDFFLKATKEVRPKTVKTDGFLKGNRGLRKRGQVESFLRILEPMVLDLNKKLGRKVKVVDFCSGTGNGSLMLAYFLRDLCDFVFVEKYQVPADICNARIKEAKMEGSARVYNCMVEEYEEAFDVGMVKNSFFFNFFVIFFNRLFMLVEC